MKFKTVKNLKGIIKVYKLRLISLCLIHSSLYLYLFNIYSVVISPSKTFFQVNSTEVFIKLFIFIPVILKPTFASNTKFKKRKTIICILT